MRAGSREENISVLKCPEKSVWKWCEASPDGKNPRAGWAKPTNAKSLTQGDQFSTVASTCERMESATAEDRKFSGLRILSLRPLFFFGDSSTWFFRFCCDRFESVSCAVRPKPQWHQRC